MRRVLADSWYARELHAVTVFDDVLPPVLRNLAGRGSIARGILLAAFGLRYDAVVTTNPSPGAAVTAALYGLLGRRRLVLLEYIVHPPGAGSRLAAAKFALLRRTLLPRALLRAQVLTDAEVDDYARLHRLPPDRFEVVRWPRRFDDAPLPARVDGRVVVASGRRTDWETFLRAAHGADWTVRVVCTAADLPRVRELAPAGTEIRYEIPADEHQRVVEGATVYVLPLAETGASNGQIRLMNAAQAGAPVVASSVRGLTGYVDADSAVMVPPGDVAALRVAVDGLLGDADRRDGLRAAARHGGGTMADYLVRLDRLIADTAH